MTKPKGVPSALATGGAGPAYEQKVGAMYLALLMHRGVPAILLDSQVEEVNFQTRRLGWETDDLLVICSLDKNKKRRLAIQIKRRINARESSSDFVQTIEGFWKDFKSDLGFDPECDAFVIATLPSTRTLMQGFGRLLQCARDSSSQADLVGRLELPGFLPKGANDCFKIIKSVVEDLDWPPPSENDLWIFLKSMYLHIVDFDGSTSQSEAWVKSLLAHSSVSSSPVDAAESSWLRLVEIATEGASGARTIRRDDLPADLLSEHRPVESLSNTLRGLREKSLTILQSIRSSIADMEPLKRSQLLATAGEALAANRVVILTGAPGSGKSALAKALVERRPSEQVTLSFRAEQFANSHLDDVFQGQLTGVQLETLMGAQESVLLHIDSLERLLEHETRDAFRDLIGTLERQDNVHLLLTCRDFAVSTSVAAFLEVGKLTREVITVPPLSDGELDEVVAAYPSLSIPLADPKLNHLLRIPYLLDKAAQMDWSDNNTLPVSERAFRERCWSELVRRDDVVAHGLPDRREKTLIELALRRARELRPFISVNELDRGALAVLHQDGVITRSTEGLVAPSHDVIEDWAIIHWLQTLAAEREWQSSSICEAVGQHPAIRRAFRGWVSEVLQFDADKAEMFITSVCGDASIPSHFRDDTIVALLLSESTDESSPFGLQSIVALQPELLIRFIHLLRTVCKRTPSLLAGESALSSNLLVPEGQAWTHVLQAVAANLDTLLPQHTGLVIGLIEDWSQGVGEPNHPEGSQAIGIIAFRLLEYLDGYSNEDQRKQVLRVIARDPLSNPERFKKLIEQVSVERKRDPFLDDFFEVLMEGFVGIPACKEFPEEMANLMVSRCLMTDDDLERFQGSMGWPSDIGISFGIRSYLPFRSSNTSALVGPFLPLLKFHPTVGVRLVLDIANHAGEWYGERKWERSVLEPAETVSTSLPSGEEVIQWSNDRLWMAYRGTSVMPNILLCALMALEKWLLEAAESEFIEEWLLYILRNSNNVMTTAVVASFCTAHHDKGGQAALALLTTRKFIQSDLMRRAKESDSRFMAALNLDPMSELYSEERRKSNELDHRREDLESLAVKLQFGTRQEEVWQILNNHISEVPDECSRTEDDRVWLLALHRMDARQFVASPYTPAQNIDVSDDSDGLTYSLALDPSNMDSDIQEIVSTNERDAQELSQMLNLNRWIEQRWENGQAEYDGNAWVDALSQVRNLLPEAGFPRLLMSEIPPKVAAICVRDYWEEMDAVDREWCVGALVDQLEVTPEHEDLTRPISGTPLTGYIMWPSGFAAYVLPSILATEPENEVVFVALARALTHASEQVVFNASQGVVEFLTDRDLELVFRCAGVIALRARILERQGTYENQPAPQGSMFRRLYKIAGNLVSRVGVRLALSPTKGWKGAEQHSQTASSMAREQFLSETINAEEEIADLDITTLNGVVAIRPILELTSRFPSSPISRAFFKKVALTIVDGWSPAQDDQDNFSQDFRSEFDEMNRLAGFVLRLEEEEAIDCCQPFLDAVDNHPDKVANFVNCLTFRKDGEDLRVASFWVIWRAFVRRIDSVPWSTEFLSRSSRGVELVQALLFDNRWGEDSFHWVSLEQNGHEIEKFVLHLPPTPALMEAYARYLRRIGSYSLPDAFKVVKSVLDRGQAQQNLLESSNTVYNLELVLQRYVHGQPSRLKSNPELRVAVLAILDTLVDAGSSVAYRMRDDFVTHSVESLKPGT